MAEAAAVVGLVASIASLIDLGAKVASRIHEFTSRTSDVPESLVAFSTRLSLLSTSLRLISSQAQAGRLSTDVVEALQPLITSTSNRVIVLQTCLSQILPPTNTSRLQRATKALKSLAKEKDIQAVVDKIHKDIDFLVLHQTTQYIDTGERILEELAKLQLGPSSSFSFPQGHYSSSVSAHDQSHAHLGDTHHTNHHKTNEVRSLGQCLSSAPVIDASNFVGRALELDRMSDVLRPGEASIEQRRLVLGGMGGIGKTQLAIAYARRHQTRYASVIWLNATSETTLHASFRSIARGLVAAEDLAKLDNDQVLARVHEWLSHPQNTQWLLIFDNYNDPDSVQIARFCPTTGHGSIVITTRLPELITDQPVRVPPLTDIDDSLAILQARSKRKDTKEGKSICTTLTSRSIYTHSGNRSGCSTSRRTISRSSSGLSHGRCLPPKEQSHLSAVPGHL